jgi:hypothetical protein
MKVFWIIAGAPTRRVVEQLQLDSVSTPGGSPSGLEPTRALQSDTDVVH